MSKRILISIRAPRICIWVSVSLLIVIGQMFVKKDCYHIVNDTKSDTNDQQIETYFLV